MTTTLGLIEWIDNTKMLKELLDKEIQIIYGSNVTISTNNKGKDMRVKFLQTLHSTDFSLGHQKLLALDSSVVVE